MYATDSRYLNDSQELVYAVSLAKKYVKSKPLTGGSRPVLDMLNLVDQIESLVAKLPVFVVSFSEQPDLLSQWRGHCSKGSGFALCLSPDRVKSLAKKYAWQLVKCVYEEIKQVEILKRIEDYSQNRFSVDKSVPMEVVFGFVLGAMGVAMKHPKFAEEAKWRVIQRLGGTPSIRPGGSTLPYVNFPLIVEAKDSLELSKLVVGPTPHASLALRSAEYLLQSKNVTCKQTIPSEIPFRNW
jgi:hypothetical protein